MPERERKQKLLQNSVREGGMGGTGGGRGKGRGRDSDREGGRAGEALEGGR